MTCKHDAAEKDTAANTDGLCPLCLFAENDRLRAALQRIASEAESDDGLTAWDGGDIAREALTGREDK